jgi:glycosyltransferase involved in cell wall biosynthesis
MKIVVDARLYGLENSGLGRYTMNLLNEFAKNKQKNIEFVILLRKKYFDLLNFPPNFKKVCIDVRHYSFAEQILLPFFLYKERADIVHFPHFNAPILYFGKYVVTIHDMLMHKFKGVSSTTLPPFFYFLKRIFYHIVFYLALIRAKIIFVPTNVVAEELSNNFINIFPKIRVLYEGVSKEFKNNYISKDKLYKKYNINRNYIIYCGNSYPHKNIKVILKAMEILEKQGFTDFDFIFVSPKNNFRDKLELEAKQLGVKSRVIFLNDLPDQDLASLMHFSSAYVFPSLSEGFGLPGLEAMATDTILLASDIPVFREVYKNFPFYFDPENPESLAYLIKKVLYMNKEEKLKKLSLVKDILNRYSWENMARQILDFYKMAINDKKEGLI